MNHPIYRCCVIGDPIAHSKSPSIHKHFANIAENAGLPIKNFDYQRQHILSDQPFAFENFVHHFFTDATGLGLNITLPFKFRAFELAKTSSLEAKLAHSANTLGLKDGQLYAHNTDGIGLINDLHAKNKILNGKTILIIGAGGATWGVLYSLIQAGVTRIYIANRSFDKANQLLATYQTRFSEILNPIHQSSITVINAISLDDLIKLEGIDLLINATPLGLINQHDDLKTDPIELIFENLAATFLNTDAMVYEMAYGFDRSLFLNLAKQMGCDYHQGLGMLLEQAKASFFHWQNFSSEQISHFNQALATQPYLL
jgi:shikimate dehydrogenase